MREEQKVATLTLKTHRNGLGRPLDTEVGLGFVFRHDQVRDTYDSANDLLGGKVSEQARSGERERDPPKRF